MSSTVARLFDAMADTYDDLEPWYEHLYDVLHAILRETIGQAPAGGGSALAGDALGYGVTPREAWRALNARDGLRLPYPGYGPLWLFTNRQLARLLGAAGLRTVRGWGVHAVTSLIPSTLLHRPRVPRAVAAAYRALRRLDAAVASTAPARALANSLVILAERAQPSA